MVDIAAAKMAAMIDADESDRHVLRHEGRKHVVTSDRLRSLLSPVTSMTIAFALARMSRTALSVRWNSPRANSAAAAAWRRAGPPPEPMPPVAGPRFAWVNRPRVAGIQRRARWAGSLRVCVLNNIGGLVEQVEYEHQDADHQHQHLQRNLPVGAHQQRTGEPHRSTWRSGSAAPGSDRSRSTTGEEQPADAVPTRTCRSVDDRR